MIEHVRACFTALVQVPEAELELDRACLWMAKALAPDLEVETYVQRLDLMAEHAALRLQDCETPHTRIAALNDYLFNAEQFMGNLSAYYDPRNSFLHEVLDRKLGIPISLSVVYMEVSRRLGIQIEGLGFPGHFLVKHPTWLGDIFIDPFNQGQILTLDECEERFDALYGAEAELDAHWLIPMSKKRILGRMLNNLKGIYLHARQPAEALKVVELALCIDPDHPDELRARGLLSLQLECFRQARADLARYLELRPDAEDRSQIEAALATASSMADRMN